MRTSTLLVALPLLSLAACAPARPAGSAVPPGSGQCTLRAKSDMQVLECQNDGVFIGLPGTRWEAEPPAGRVFVAASMGLFHVSARHSPLQGQPDVPTHLREVEATLPKEPPHTTPQHAKSRKGADVFSYDITGLAVEGKAVKSTHVWTAARREDGGWVDFHVSWTGPADHPALASEPGKPTLVDLLHAMADGFVTVDHDGKVLRAP